MIYTLTCNPAIDYIVNVDNYREGAVNRTAEEKILPGGKGINVSIVLSNLGAANTALGFISGFTGEEIERLLCEEGIKTDFIRLKNGCSRINIKLKADAETEINGQGPKIDSDELEKMYSKLDKLNEGDFLVLAGSIPKGLPDTMYCDIIKRISDKKVNVVVDSEKNLLRAVLPYKPFLIKPNHHELGDMFGKELTDTDEIIQCALKLREEGVRNVFVSMAGDGGILAAEDGSVIYAKAPKGKVINSTGAGDSALAGFLAEYIKSRDYKEALIKGICAGSASAFSENLALKPEVDALLSSVEVRCFAKKIEHMRK